ncbi:MAG TPA: rhodanese-like domain-containing protein [Microvirga sp.]|jgi:rhodanese-related sulfurtransferase|nr:rhodanese-like domain-containing protein [Microvirga sp.]
MAALDPRTAKQRLHASGEIACLDVREHGPYGEGHPLLAVPCPYSRLELAVGALVPRRNVPILLVDDGDGVAERASARLSRLGYTQVDWIAGGAPAWSAAGFTLFKGVNVPSKTLGELVEETWHVPQVGPDDLERWRAEGRAVRLFDGRPASEHAKMTIPGSRCMPNGELAHRWSRAVGAESGPVVVHCAGRTRSLVGAAGLMIAGAREVYALENGTQGWTLSGRDLLHGARAEPLPPADAQESRRRALAIAEAHAIPWIDRDAAQALARDGGRTTYLFDVRDPDEHRLSPHLAARSAPGGQLVQATDQWIGVRRARVILADDTGLRAALAAFWLRQLGYEVSVLPDLPDWPADWRLDWPDAPAAAVPSRIPTVAAAEAVARARRGEPLLDLRPSPAYRAAHLEGARWSTRARLPAVRGATVMLAGDAPVVALAAADLREAGAAALLHVEGDEAAWRGAGLSLAATPQDPSDAEAVDYLFFVHDRHDGNLDAARRYLAWERGLTAQLDPQERAAFTLDATRF